MMRKIRTTMIRLILKYAKVIYSHLKKKHVFILELIEIMVTKMGVELKDLSYEERFKEIQLTWGFRDSLHPK